MRGEEESTDLRTFLADDSTIDEQLKAIDGSFSNYLQRKLEFGRQPIKDSAASAMFFHLKVNPNSLGEMLPLLTQVVDSENWIDGSSVKRQAIEWLERAQTPEATQVINKHEQRVKQQHIEQQRLAEQERLRRENEKRETEQRQQEEIISKCGSLEAYRKYQNTEDLKGCLKQWWPFCLFCTWLVVGGLLSIFRAC